MKHEPPRLPIGKGLKASWESFLKGPEVYILLTLGWMVLYYVLTKIPRVGPLFSLAISALALPSFFLLAEEGRKRGRITFSSLLQLAPLAPQLLALFLVKSILVTLGFLLFVLPGVYLLVIYLYAELFVCVEGKAFWVAMESSRAKVRGHWFRHFGLAVVLALIVLTGALFVGVGLLAAIPIAALLLHAVFIETREPEVLPS